MERTANAQPPRIVYVVGMGRSGTTLLDTMLGSGPGWLSVGELWQLWGGGQRCGCGAPIETCGFWRAVRERVGRTPGVLRPAEMAGIQNAMLRLRNIAQLPRRGTRSAALQAYARTVRALYVAIAEVSGAEVIVDSSKRPQDAYVLARCTDLAIYVVHVIRDPRAVAYSWSKQRHEEPLLQVPPMRCAVRWQAWNIATETLVRSEVRRRYHRVHYEWLASAPRSVVRDVSVFVDGVPSTAQFIDASTVCLGPNHTVSGNPARFARGAVTVRPDAEWRTRMPMGAKAAAAAGAMPGMLWYGYRPTMAVNPR